MITKITMERLLSGGKLSLYTQHASASVGSVGSVGFGLHIAICEEQ
jgi:hypothetical protein